MTLIAYDERYRWETYAGTLPCSRAQLVSAKYIMGLCILAATFVPGSVVMALSMSKSGGLEPVGYFCTLALLAGAAVAAPALFLPFVFKLGAEKGRIFYLAVLLASCLGVSSLLPDKVATLRPPYTLTAAGALAAAALIYAASWLLSIHFYRKRQL